MNIGAKSNLSTDHGLIACGFRSSLKHFLRSLTGRNDRTFAYHKD
jgi:hypothetical protein